MYDGLRVRMGFEPMALALEFLLQGLKIVDLSVKGYPDGAVLVGKWLLP